jgi:outer membrane protein assembly factor BamB
VPATSAGGVVFAGAGAAVWALDASTGAILKGGQPFLSTGGQMRMPVTIDGSWVFVLDNNGNLYAFTTDSSYAAIQPKYRAPTARQRMNWQRSRQD